MLSYLKTYRARHWVLLAVLSLAVSTCAVVGESFRSGQGEPTYSFTDCLLYIYVGAIAFALFLLLTNWALDALAGYSARKRAGKAGDASKADEAGKANEVGETNEAGGTGGESESAICFQKAARVLGVITPRWSAKSIAIFAVIMLVMWAPWIVAYFPAPLNVDLYFQIYQFFPDSVNYIIPFNEKAHNVQVDSWLVDHHPFFTTMIYGAFGWVSEQLTGSWVAGIFACSMLQAVCFVIVYLAVVAMLRKCGCPIGLCFSIWVFFAVVPFIPVWSIALTKDSMFTLFFILYLLMVFESYRTRGGMFARPRNVVLFILCSLLLCLTKKTGVYLVIIVSLALAWRFRAKRVKVSNAGNDSGSEGVGAEIYSRPAGDGATDDNASALRNASAYCHSERSEESFCDAESRKSRPSCLPKARPSMAFLGSALASALLMFVVLPLVLFPMANIHPGGKQEALGLLFQQTARYVVQHPDEVTPGERDAISGVLAYDEISEKYHLRIHDEVKFLYNQSATTQDLLDYAQAYILMGMKHPETYFEAFMGAANFYMAYTTPVYITLSSYTEYERDLAYTPEDELDESLLLAIWSPEETKALRQKMSDAYYALADIPVINLPLRLALYTMWIPAALLLFIQRRDLCCKVMLLPGLLSFLFCLISPMGAARYAVPLFCSAVLLVGMVVAHERKHSKPTKQSARPR